MSVSPLRGEGVGETQYSILQIRYFGRVKIKNKCSSFPIETATVHYFHRPGAGVVENRSGSDSFSLVSRLEAGLSGTYTANTHPLSLVKTCRGSPLIGLIRFYK